MYCPNWCRLGHERRLIRRGPAGRARAHIRSRWRGRASLVSRVRSPWMLPWMTWRPPRSAGSSPAAPAVPRSAPSTPLPPLLSLSHVLLVYLPPLSFAPRFFPFSPRTLSSPPNPLHSPETLSSPGEPSPLFLNLPFTRCSREFTSFLVLAKSFPNKKHFFDFLSSSFKCRQKFQKLFSLSNLSLFWGECARGEGCGGPCLPNPKELVGGRLVG
jgi:hypothetical protein